MPLITSTTDLQSHLTSTEEFTYFLNDLTERKAPNTKKSKKMTHSGTSGTVAGIPPAIWILRV